MKIYVIYSGDGAQKRTIDAPETIENDDFFAAIENAIESGQIDIDEAAERFANFAKG